MDIWHIFNILAHKIFKDIFSLHPNGYPYARSISVINESPRGMMR